MNISCNERAIKDIVDQLGNVVKNELRRLLQTCVTCEHFTKDNEHCTLAKRRPPAEVIANGCSSYEPEIPF